MLSFRWSIVLVAAVIPAEIARISATPQLDPNTMPAARIVSHANRQRLLDAREPIDTSSIKGTCDFTYYPRELVSGLDRRSLEADRPYFAYFYFSVLPADGIGRF